MYLSNILSSEFSLKLNLSKCEYHLQKSKIPVCHTYTYHNETVKLTYDTKVNENHIVLHFVNEHFDNILTSRSSLCQYMYHSDQLLIKTAYHGFVTTNTFIQPYEV